jgi:hypothetical protein
MKHQCLTWLRAVLERKQLQHLVTLTSKMIANK